MHGFIVHSDAFRIQQLELSVNYSFCSRRSESHILWLLSSFLSFSPFLLSFLFLVKIFGVLFRYRSWCQVLVIHSEEDKHIVYPFGTSLFILYDFLQDSVE